MLFTYSDQSVSVHCISSSFDTPTFDSTYVAWDAWRYVYENGTCNPVCSCMLVLLVVLMLCYQLCAGLLVLFHVVYIALTVLLHQCQCGVINRIFSGRSTDEYKWGRTHHATQAPLMSTTTRTHTHTHTIVFGVTLQHMDAGETMKLHTPWLPQGLPEHTQHWRTRALLLQPKFNTSSTVYVLPKTVPEYTTCGACDIDIKAMYSNISQ